MKPSLKGALIALTLVATPALMSAPASAAVDFSVTLGNAAFGYSDGYWDRDHHWHHWRNRDEQRYFQTHYHEHYYGQRHDREHAHMGWREEHWW